MTLHFPQVEQGTEGVRVTLNYLRRSGTRPFSYAYPPPLGTPQRSGEIDAVPNVLIRNARLLGDELSLDEQGFFLAQYATAVEDFYDESEILDIYYPESEQLLKLQTGASKVVIFDHTIRSVPLNNLGIAGFKAPVRNVHND